MEPTADDLEFTGSYFRYTAPVETCSYLPEERASLTYRAYFELSPDRLEELISRGWRRFTSFVFRPACEGCQKCVSIRVPVASFQASKSQRRNWKRNQHIHWELQPASVTQAHVQLYNLWHANRSEERGWRDRTLTPETYYENFLAGDFPSLHDLLYFEGDRLVGVGLVDVLAHALSSVYFYYHPDWAPSGPGTFSALCELEYARQQGLEHVYFGYWIAQCPSMAYKNRFGPYEILEGFPSDDEAPRWLAGN